MTERSRWAEPNGLSGRCAETDGGTGPSKRKPRYAVPSGGTGSSASPLPATRRRHDQDERRGRALAAPSHTRPPGPATAAPQGVAGGG